MQYSAGKPKTLKKNNRKFVLDTLRSADVLTITESNHSGNVGMRSR